MNILIIEDEDRMRKLLRDYFKKEGFCVFEGENGIKGLEIFKSNTIDIVILDIMIPYLDGWKVCKNIREVSKVPIVMLTAKSEEEDKLLGYELGADDYVTKPFSPKVLVAKVKALLKRSIIDIKAEKDIINYNGLEINELSNEVKIDGKVIVLSPKEYDLLLFFVKNKDIVLSRDKILDRVWGFDYDGGLRTVDTHIKRLREKLKNKVDYIVTVRGKGYKFEVN
ncbi:response regulator transcription factor [Clostridium botulinum D/C]|uniref:response regulator transcription factor n=1 Tax=Clostridium botulinum TaxID=1491 RepID=UPI001E3622CA|nr:response regulator transcription factor [Clostridium botulinum]MCD3350079.1 response regulator transcription factor [Clostridium botulinum D/C]MCD3359219.1 response regulator transcription factor [Clostridium botulinum D/C]MCD3362579.1 response regulator transcription factor [Clostridium botulinum D/C]MCD3364914.1 response regulator transcription factor [Clostridium botulinum D/C]